MDRLSDRSPSCRGSRLNRRMMLRLAGICSAGLLAGCFGDDAEDDGTPTDTPADEAHVDPSMDATDEQATDVPTTEARTTTEPPTATDTRDDEPDGFRWDVEADAIIEAIEEPTFPDEEFDVTTYGAVGDGESDDAAAFEEAIAACTDAGGGRVVVPAGTYRHEGPIHLEDDVNLHVTPEATVTFGTRFEDYRPVVRTWWEGNELMGHSPLIYAHEKENVAITGGGTFESNADSRTWWRWDEEEDDDARRLIEMNRDGVPVDDRVFGEGTHLRPPFVQPFGCERVMIEDVTFVDSPFWFIHLPLCEHVTVRRVTTDGHGPNNDGCNPEFARNVLIEDCVFDNGDDNVALKAGRNRDGRRVGRSTENVVIQNCRMREGHGAIVAGSEMSGGIRNVYARGNVMNSPDLAWPVRIKSNSHRGGFVTEWYVWDTSVLDIDSGGEHVRINTMYQTRHVLPAPDEGGGEHPPEIRNINLENVASSGRAPLWYLRGSRESPIRELTVRDSSFVQSSLGFWNAHVEDVSLEAVETGMVPGETTTDLVELTQPSPELFGITFEDVVDRDGAPVDDARPYLEVTTAEAGAEYYVDRDYVIESLPDELAGGTLIKGKNDDRQLRTADVPEYLAFEAREDVTVHVAFHPGGEDAWWPDWRADWDQSAEIEVSDPYLDDPHFVVFQQDFEAGKVVLGPNDSDTGSSASYFTIVT